MPAKANSPYAAWQMYVVELGLLLSQDFLCSIITLLRKCQLSQRHLQSICCLWCLPTTLVNPLFNYLFPNLYKTPHRQFKGHFNNTAAMALPATVHLDTWIVIVVPIAAVLLSVVVGLIVRKIYISKSTSSSTSRQIQTKRNSKEPLIKGMFYTTLYLYVVIYCSICLSLLILPHAGMRI